VTSAVAKASDPALQDINIGVEADRLDVRARVELGAARSRSLQSGVHPMLFRPLGATDGRFVEAPGPDGRGRRLLMFGSNSYLGLSQHPDVVAAARRALDEHGFGSPGSPFLNGTTALHRELEERLAALKGAEDATLFGSGYAANVGVYSSLASRHDVVVFDALVHASAWDGLKLSGCRHHRRFRHNDAGDLDEVLGEETACRDRFVGVDGVYSMDGDLAPLDEIAAVTSRHGALLIVDDAHATGVVGPDGRGTASHFGVEHLVDVTVGTLGKSYGVMGAWASGSRDLVEFLRSYARSNTYSTALPPAMVAACLAAHEVMAREPERRVRLLDLVRRAADGLRPLGLVHEPEAALLALRAPGRLDVEAAMAAFDEAGIFLSYVMHPIVPREQQRFRISITAAHEPEDIDRLVEVTHEVFAHCLLAEAPHG
jgi:glycine C-acetyltransferase